MSRSGRPQQTPTMMYSAGYAQPDTAQAQQIRVGLRSKRVDHQVTAILKIASTLPDGYLEGNRFIELIQMPTRSSPLIELIACCVDFLSAIVPANLQLVFNNYQTHFEVVAAFLNLLGVSIGLVSQGGSVEVPSVLKSEAAVSTEENDESIRVEFAAVAEKNAELLKKIVELEKISEEEKAGKETTEASTLTDQVEKEVVDGSTCTEEFPFEDLQQAVAVLEMDVSSLEATNEILEDKLCNYENETPHNCMLNDVLSLDDELRILTSENSTLNNSLKNGEKKVNQLQQELQALEEERQLMEEAAGVIPIMNKALVLLKYENEKLKDNLYLSFKKNDSLQEELKDERKKAEAMKHLQLEEQFYQPSPKVARFKPNRQFYSAQEVFVNRLTGQLTHNQSKDDHMDYDTWMGLHENMTLVAEINKVFRNCRKRRHSDTSDESDSDFDDSDSDEDSPDDSGVSSDEDE
ncbi:hypothetical protein QR680_016007 [Steinernema hermaphroditum]|uniref:Uncharacterized protein n=1 Tax=Steinernema hermaphroditum TaxID=289476 RepID=A0AA39H9Q1_9BILA|nr:hypothetical protein QR680_016007 [Steinernema hermaphroditum]